MSITIDWNNSYCVVNNRVLRVNVHIAQGTPPPLDLNLTRGRVTEIIPCGDISASRSFRGTLMCAIYGSHAGADRRTG